MLQEIQCTLLADGSSDIVLEHHLKWLMAQYTDLPIMMQFADLRRLRHVPHNFAERILRAVELYPCEVLFIHRDAEKMSREIRVSEIQAACTHIQVDLPTVICVIPVRMQEAWLLFDEQAIRWAAGNPHGRQQLAVPAVKKIESIADPKKVLHDLLRAASELRGQRLSSFRPERAAHRVADFIDDFSPLESLPAFAALKTEIQQMIEQ